MSQPFLDTSAFRGLVVALFVFGLGLFFVFGAGVLLVSPAPKSR